MNELIKKLANESGYYLYDLTETHGIKTVETDSKDEWITLEKFAELILKECIDVADDYVKDCLCEEHIKCNHPRSKIGIKIKERFGIEE